MATKTRAANVPPKYDPSQFPAFAVTVDVVILTMADDVHAGGASETAVDVPSLLTQFGAYGDPGRAPRMNVVTVAYLAVLRDVGPIVAGTDAAHAALVPASDVLEEKIELAFDHLRIVRDAVERVRVELEV